MHCINNTKSIRHTAGAWTFIILAHLHKTRLECRHSNELAPDPRPQTISRNIPRLIVTEILSARNLLNAATTHIQHPEFTTTKLIIFRLHSSHLLSPHLARKSHHGAIEGDVQVVVHFVVFAPIFPCALLEFLARHFPEVGTQDAVCWGETWWVYRIRVKEREAWDRQSETSMEEHLILALLLEARATSTGCLCLRARLFCLAEIEEPLAYLD